MLEFHPLRLAEHLDLSQAGIRASMNTNLHLVYAAQRGSQVTLPAGWLSLWLPLRSALQLQSALGRWTVQQQLLIAQEGCLSGIGQGPATWLVLAGPSAIWRKLLTQIAPDNGCNELLLRQQACPRDVRRAFIHLARILRDGTGAAERDVVLHALCTALLDQQRDLQLLAARCNGRTPQRRLLTLQRLLRVRQLIERDNDGRLDLARLARSANYSPWHLIRLYREVFGATPSEHLAQRRLARAWSLVRGSALPVCEITEKLGFESESAFCRAFKNAYGLTTTQARHLPTGVRACIPHHGRTRLRHAQSQTA